MSEIIINDEQGILFSIDGSTDNYVVNVWKDTYEWFCNCPDHHFRKHDCKHILAAKELI